MKSESGDLFSCIEGDADCVLQAAAGGAEYALHEVETHPWETAGIVALGVGLVIAAPLAGVLGASVAVVAGIDAAVTVGGTVIGVAGAAYGTVKGSMEIYHAVNSKDGKNACHVLTHAKDYTPLQIDAARGTIRRTLGPGAFDVGTGTLAAAGVAATGPRLAALAEGVSRALPKVTVEVPPPPPPPPTPPTNLNGVPPIHPDVGADVVPPSKSPAGTPADRAPAHTEPGSRGGRTADGTNTNDRSQPHTDVSPPHSRPDFSRGPDPSVIVKRVMQPVQQDIRATSAARRSLEQAMRNSLGASRYKEASQKIGEYSFMQDLIAEHPELKLPYESYTHAYFNTLWKMSTALNIVDAEHGVPPVHIGAPEPEDPHTLGEYSFNGMIAVRPQDLGDAVIPSRLVDVVTHENEHHVQMTLLIAGCIEKIAGNAPLNAEKARAVQLMLSKLTGQPIRPNVIVDVDRYRTAAGSTGERVPLSENEWSVFEKLWKSKFDLVKMSNVDVSYRIASSIRIRAPYYTDWAIRAFAADPNLGSDVSEPPAFMTKFLGHEQTKNWPELPPNQLVLPQEPEPWGAFLAEFDKYLAGRQTEMEAQARDGRGLYRRYRSWEHEKRAFSAGGEARRQFLITRPPFYMESPLFLTATTIYGLSPLRDSAFCPASDTACPSRPSK